jgi:hypothetical protein
VLRVGIGCFLVPTLVAAWLFLVDVRYMQVGGGNPTSLPRACTNVVAWSLGAPFGQRAAPAVAAVGLAAFAAAGWLLRRRAADPLALFTAVLTAVSLGLVAILGTEFLYVRHFIVVIAFLLLAVSFALARLYEQGPCQRAVSLGLLGLFVLTNGLQTAELWRYGRGRYGDAIRFMAEHTDRPEAVVGGDHDFRVQMVFDFHRQELGIAGLPYIPHESWPRQGVDWLICHRESQEPAAPLAGHIQDGGGNRYGLVAIYPAAPLSGLHWFLYKREPLAPPG